MNVVREQGAIDIYYLGFIQKELEIQSGTMVKYSTMIKYTVCLLIWLTYRVWLKFPVLARAQTSSRYIYIQTQPMLWLV